MIQLYTFITIIILVIITIRLIEEFTFNKNEFEYDYKKQLSLLTKTEGKFYNILNKIVEKNNIVFVQVHLSSLLEHKIIGQNWKAAFRHINQKSVDFVICDKENISPKLVIELDDKSHERPDRQKRDTEVERILKNAKIPLLRIQNNNIFNIEEITQKINEILISKN